MAIRRFTGERIFPLFLDSDVQLEKNRFVKINTATNKCAYTAFGESADGVTRTRSNDDNFDTTVMPLDFADTTFFVNMVSAVSVGDKILPSKDGKGVTASYSVKSMTLLDFPGAPDEGDTYVVFGDDWKDEEPDPDYEPVAGTIVQYDGADWVEIGTVAELEGIAIYNETDGKYYISNKTAWVEVKVAAISGGEGLAGATVVCYNITVPSSQSVFDYIGDIVAVGSTAPVTHSTGTIDIEDGKFKEGDIVLATLKSADNAIYVTKAVVTDSKLEITLSAAGGESTSVNYIVVRPK